MVEIDDLLSQDEKSVKISSEIVLHNLDQYPTEEAIWTSIRPHAGVYIWYPERASIPQEADEALQALEDLVLEKHHFPEQSTKKGWAPLFNYELKIKPHEKVSPKLRDSLEDYLKYPETIDALGEVLHLSLLLSHPLYIGCASSMKERVKQHIDGESGLRKRLSEGGHEMPQCRLITISIRGIVYDEETEKKLEEKKIKSREESIEDILSRIFKPTYVKRFG